jgi:hypothetical protein
MNADIYWFQTVMQGQFDVGLWGVHTGGHFTIGGDPGGVRFQPFLAALYFQSAHFDFWRGKIGFVLLAGRPSLFPASWIDRSSVVDLADSRLGEEAKCHLGHDYIAQ